MNSRQCDMKPIIKTVCIESIANGPRELAVAITGRSAWQQNKGKKKGSLAAGATDGGKAAPFKPARAG